jgi:hypothetical protein
MSVLHFFAQENIHFDGTYHRIMEQPQTESTKEDQIEGKKIFFKFILELFQIQIFKMRY